MTDRTASPLLQHCVEVALSQTWRKNKTALEINKRLQTGRLTWISQDGRPRHCREHSTVRVGRARGSLCTWIHVQKCDFLFRGVTFGFLASVWVHLLRAPTCPLMNPLFSRWLKFFNLVGGQKGLRVPALGYTFLRIIDCFLWTVALELEWNQTLQPACLSVLG